MEQDKVICKKWYEIILELKGDYAEPSPSEGPEQDK